MDVCLRNYGYCNFLSDKHCSIFYDEVSEIFICTWMFRGKFLKKIVRI
jgi:hypothetical protein